MDRGDAAMGDDEALGRGWPDDSAEAAYVEPRPAGSFGPTFAYRARWLWAFTAILGLVAAVILFAEALFNGIVAAGLVLEVLVFGLTGVASIAAYHAIGNRGSWVATPSLVLGTSLVLGGVARAVLTLATAHSLTIPLEAIAAAWLLNAGDRPGWRLGRPADRRTAVVAVLAIAIELPSFAPLLPNGVPGVDALSSGPDAMDVQLRVQCPDSKALWERADVEVHWQWHGFDLVTNADDELTLAFSGPDTGLSWDPTDWTSLQYSSMDAVGSQMRLTIPRGQTQGQVTSLLIQQGDTAPFTVTARFAHAGRWEVTRAVSCGG